MYIYNVTTNVDESVHLDWLKWMKEKHIPDMLATGKFLKALMTQVLVEEEMGGITYSVQYICDSKEMLQKYYQEDAIFLKDEPLRLFPGKFGSFRTELKVIEEFNQL